MFQKLAVTSRSDATYEVHKEPLECYSIVNCAWEWSAEAAARSSAEFTVWLQLSMDALNSSPARFPQTQPRASCLVGTCFLDPARVYGSYQEMAEQESALGDDQSIDFVSIVVRNNLHFDVARTFLNAGINVICDKPLAFSLEQGKELQSIVESSGKVFALTHNYTGYPMVKEAKAMVRDGKLGRILKVVAEYPQGYAITAVERRGGRSHLELAHGPRRLGGFKLHWRYRLAR